MTAENYAWFGTLCAHFLTLIALFGCGVLRLGFFLKLKRQERFFWEAISSLEFLSSLWGIQFGTLAPLLYRETLLQLHKGSCREIAAGEGCRGSAFREDHTSGSFLTCFVQDFCAFLVEVFQPAHPTSRIASI